jgi:tetratricopeptide (TPR) repeat protein
VLDTREILAGFLGSVASLGRSSRFDLRRHAALHGAERLRQAAAVRGATPASVAKRGRFLRLGGADAEAAESFADACRRAPGAPEALAWRWELGVSTGRADDADLDRALAADPDRAAWRAWRGLRRLLTRRDPGSDLDRAARAGGAAAVVARVGLAQARRRRGDARGAVRQLDAALALAPREGWLLRLRAKARFLAGDEAGFVADCEAENLADEGIGTLAFAFGEKAMTSPRALTRRLDAELRRRPDAYWLLALRGDARRAPEVGDHAGGHADLEEAARLAPRPGWVLGHLARARLSQGDRRGALAACDDAVRAEPRCGWLRAWRGATRLALGDAAGARADLDAAEALDPDYDLLYQWRAAASRKSGRLDDALSDLELACALTPARGVLWAQRARVLRESGRRAEAAACEARAGDGGYERETEARRRRDGPPSALRVAPSRNE